MNVQVSTERKVDGDSEFVRAAVNFFVVDLKSNFMEIGNHLKSLLQFQLVSDTSSVTNLPYCLSTLTAECLLPSAHLAKWTSRINSLMYSKESGARWAGLCLAQKTSILSQTIMTDCAQSWLVVALPALSVREYILFSLSNLICLSIRGTNLCQFSKLHCVLCA